jgi:predicted KAP-like P-loop ATPase
MTTRNELKFMQNQRNVRKKNSQKKELEIEIPQQHSVVDEEAFEIETLQPPQIPSETSDIESPDVLHLVDHCENSTEAHENINLYMHMCLLVYRLIVVSLLSLILIVLVTK